MVGEYYKSESKLVLYMGLTGCQDPYAPQNVEFVPMFWGHTNVTQSNIDMVNDLYRQKKIFYVLGFNEPDLKEEGLI